MTEETPRLILMTAPIIGADVPALVEKLAAAAEASDVASVVLRLAPGVDDKALAPLVRFAEEHNAALLLADDSSRAARASFDGAHMGAGVDGLREAIKALQPKKVVGAGGVDTRDEAMEAGETGADYVMFGESGALAHAVSLVEWWSEVMEPPCAGYAQSVDAVAALARAGADFIALAPELWAGEAGVEPAWRAALEAPP